MWGCVCFSAFALLACVYIYFFLFGIRACLLLVFLFENLLYIYIFLSVVYWETEELCFVQDGVEKQIFDEYKNAFRVRVVNVWKWCMGICWCHVLSASVRRERSICVCVYFVYFCLNVTRIERRSIQNGIWTLRMTCDLINVTC